jgi:tRNA-specific 2-thiouridylase
MARSGGKVVLAMSGGVDSSVAAALLQQRGHEVVGVFMRLGSPDEAEAAAGYTNEAACGISAGVGGTIALPVADSRPVNKRGCCSVNDAADARLVASHLGLPFYAINFRRDFGRVIDYFVDEYQAGRTPNPCVRCNDWLKFGKLWEYARSIEATHVASGHYAQVVDGPDGPQLRRGVDAGKDQSYVLFGTPRDRLGHMLLPVGGLQKDRTRRIAADLGLPVFDKPDSQEVCFVPDNDYAGLVQRRAGGELPTGSIVDTDGRVLGEHGGQQRFTIGQRRGLGLQSNQPLYVVHKDAASNTVVVGPREALGRTHLEADQANWLIDAPADWRRCGVQVRYNSPASAGRVRAVGEAKLEVRLDEPVDAAAPGQAVVCYDGERVIGGGWITRAW